jgi:predicted transcriptional regulator/DNA-binding CsgD family transcriptional regulator
MEPLGVSELEERVYRAVLAAPEITRAELIDALDRGSRGVVNAIRRLEDLGLVGRVEGWPRRFVPVYPEVALESLLQTRQQELLQARTAAAELVAEYHATRRDNPGELVEILSGERAVALRFAELQASCREELLLFDRPPYAAAPDNPQQVSVLRRGIRWRTVYAPESLQRAHALDHVARLAAAGEQARMLPGLPMKLVVADRRVALLPLTLDSALAQTAVIHRSTLLDAMVTLFDLFWQRAVPVGPAIPAPDGDPAGAADLVEEDRRILALLVTGAKDEAIARELGIGVRTLRRRMRHLMETLDAETRFQAGIQASRRGLV